MFHFFIILILGHVIIGEETTLSKPPEEDRDGRSIGLYSSPGKRGQQQWIDINDQIIYIGW